MWVGAAGEIMGYPERADIIRNWTSGIYHIQAFRRRPFLKSRHVANVKGGVSLRWRCHLSLPQASSAVVWFRFGARLARRLLPLIIKQDQNSLIKTKDFIKTQKKSSLKGSCARSIVRACCLRKIQSSGRFLSWFQLKLAGNNDADKTVICVTILFSRIEIETVRSLWTLSNTEQTCRHEELRSCVKVKAII